MALAQDGEKGRALRARSTGEPHQQSATGVASSLVDARFDHDSCGVGFVASVLGKADHKIVTDALTALARLEHRGAVAADGISSDGIGIMTGVPRELLLESTGFKLDAEQALGVGMVFLPAEEKRAEGVLESSLRAQELKVLGWRDVPTRPEVLGEIALSTMPKIRQVLVVDAATGDADPMERRLYLARKQFERAVEAFDDDDCVQVDVPGAPAAGVLSRSGLAEVCVELCAVPSALCDQYAAGVASRAAGTDAGTQRRDQYGLGQPVADGGAGLHAAGGVQAGADKGRNRLDQPG